MALRPRIPGFRGTCIAVGVTYVLLGGSILARGVPASLAPFGVPPDILASPHYVDAIWWVYTHMVVLGGVMLVLGRFAEGAALKLWMARMLFVAHVYYTWLDIRASDSAWGTGLYQGPASVAPAVIAGLSMLAFMRLSFSRWADPPTSQAG